MASSMPMENAATDAAGVAARLLRARDELLTARDVLESLGKQGQAMALANIVHRLEDLLEAIDPATARAYPGSVEQ